MRSFFSASPLYLVLGLVALHTTGCAGTIPNTRVRDTPENREVVAFMEEYRHAIEDRDVPALLGMASPRYLDRAGTVVTTDDINYEQLRERLRETFARVEDVRYEILYRRITYRESGDVLVEYRYTASFLIRDNDGEMRWRHPVNDQRMVLRRDEETENYRILSGM